MTSESGDEGIIEFKDISPGGMDPAEPKPAHKHIPEWYENLDYEKERGRHTKTVKSCIPFMEALTLGWIVPIPVDISLQFDEEGREMTIEGDDDLVVPHELDQLGGRDNPMLPKPVLKFRTPWVARTPDGYSTLFVPPMNRAEPRFQPFSGVVDTDDYITTVNAPSLWLQPGFDGTIEKGTPLLQAIPFKREAVGLDGRTTRASATEAETAKHVSTAASSMENFYQENFWNPKRKDREVPD